MEAPPGGGGEALRGGGRRHVGGCRGDGGMELSLARVDYLQVGPGGCPLTHRPPAGVGEVRGGDGR